MAIEEVVFGVSDFVALVNQTFEYAYPVVTISGELANFKVSKNKWIYFDLKDDFASVRFFGTVYTLLGPLEDGMLLEVRGNPRLHPQFGFSVTVQSMRPVGEGSIKKAAALLETKLRQEGLFDEARKRPLLYPPATIGLITSKESAAFADFIKVLNQRWRGLEIRFIDVQVQGEPAPGQIVGAIEQFNQAADQPEALVLIRGGGSTDDLQAFSTEQVTRAVAASRIPTLVAIGHEIDVSLAELAADQRASTPSNAAELLVPDRRDAKRRLKEQTDSLSELMTTLFADSRATFESSRELATQLAEASVANARRDLARRVQLITAFSPLATLRRGYAIVRSTEGTVIRSGKQLAADAIVDVELFDAHVTSMVTCVRGKG